MTGSRREPPGFDFGMQKLTDTNNAEGWLRTDWEMILDELAQITAGQGEKQKEPQNDAG